MSAPEVLVVGEALMDIVSGPAGTVEHPGGSPANVAYGLGRLGVDTCLLTSLGEDDRGRNIAAHLASAGVQVLPGPHRTDRTATATAVIGGDGAAGYAFDLRWALRPVACPQPPRLLHTGSLATFLQPGAAAVRSLVRDLAGQCLISYDPNIRPSLLGSPEETLPLFEELARSADVVKLSGDDAGWLYPAASPLEAAARILALGPALAVVTLGGDGVLLRTAAFTLELPAVPALVSDTIGAGDSFTAALIAGLLAETSGSAGIPDLAALDADAVGRIGRSAARAAAITVGRPGANPPTAAELTESIPA